MAQVICVLLIAVIGVFVFSQFKFKSSVKQMALAAIFIVIVAVIKRLTIMVPLFGTESLKIGFEVVAMMVAGVMLEPGYAYIAGIAMDLIGLIVAPTSFPFFGFTLVCCIETTLPSIITRKVTLKNTKIWQTGITIGTSALAILAAIYIWTMKTITVSETVVTLNTGFKILMSVLCIVMIIVLQLAIHYLKGKEKEEDLYFLYKWIAIVIITELICTFFLTPLWLQIMYSIPFFLSFFIRVIKECIMIPLDIIVGYTCLKVLRKVNR